MNYVNLQKKKNKFVSKIQRVPGELAKKYKDRLDEIEKNGELKYTCYKMRKSSGGYRTISIPSLALKKFQKDLLIDLQNLIFISKHATGFRKLHSPISNALLHGEHLNCIDIKARRKLCFNKLEVIALNYDDATKEEMVSFAPGEGIGMDIKDAFGSISPNILLAGIKKAKGFIDANDYDIIQRACFNKNKLPQGAPTSPFLLNVALVPFDRYLVRLLKNKIEKKFKTDFSYTRFADDITITTSQKGIARKAINLVICTGKRLGLQINKRKTRIMTVRTGIFITGINVINSGSHYSIARRERDRIKAAIHELQYKNKQDPDYNILYDKLVGRVGYLLTIDRIHGAKLLSKAINAKVFDSNIKFNKRTAAQTIQDTTYIKQKRKQFFTK
jgi:hypothetical protein